MLFKIPIRQNGFTCDKIGYAGANFHKNDIYVFNFLNICLTIFFREIAEPLRYTEYFKEHILWKKMF